MIRYDDDDDDDNGNNNLFKCSSAGAGFAHI